mgnify:CR=1 FL=1
MNNKNNNGFLRNAFLYIIVIIAVVTGVQYFAGGSQSPSQQLSYTQLVKKIEDGKVKSITYQPDGSIIEVKGSYKKAEKVDTDLSLPFLGGASSETRSFTSTVLQNETTMQALQSASEAADVNVKMIRESSSGAWISYLFSYLPLIGIAIFFLFMMNQGGNRGAMNFGRNRAKTQSKENIKVRFTDVAGAEEEKQELVEVVEFLKDPRKFSALGARIPAGVLLEGPPGTGKTLLAKAVAGEAGVPFFSISGSDFVEMFVGVGASRVRDLFDQAKKAAPSIIFIDEIDAVGRQRGAGMGGGHDEREQTLNQLLVEMDGFTGNEGVIVIAATNRSDVLDPALLRPGRFDRKILVGRPDVKGREAILKVHAKNKPLAPSVDLKEVARQTPGFVGADLENLLNEAALVAARRSKKAIDASDVDEAEDRVIAGPAKRDRVINPKERNMVAFHEAGHAIVGLVLSDSRTVRKVTIIPRGRAGGYAIMLPKDDQFLLTKKELTEQIVGLLGGRTAEEIIFGVESTGASNDFEQATQIARSMVTQYGMSDRLGTVQLETEGQPFLGAQYGQTPPYSETTATAIDDEIRRIIDDAHKQAHEIIEAHREQHKLIAEALLKYETLNEKEILSLFNDGKMPARDQDEFPSEKAATFEQSKAALEHKDKEKQADEEASGKTDSPQSGDQQASDDDTDSDEVEKPDDTSTDNSSSNNDDQQGPQA